MATTRLDWAGLADNDPWPSADWEGIRAGGTVDVQTEQGRMVTGPTAWGGHCSARTVIDNWPEEFDFTAKITRDVEASYFWGIAATAGTGWRTGWWNPTTCYRFEREAVAGGGWWLYRHLNDTQAEIASGTTDTWASQNVRMQGEWSGDDLIVRVKVWEAGTSEPAGWLVEHTDSSPLLGVGHAAVGVSNGHVAESHTIRWEFLEGAYGEDPPPDDPVTEHVWDGTEWVPQAAEHVWDGTQWV